VTGRPPNPGGSGDRNPERSRRLEELRDEILAADRELVELVAKRRELVLEIGRLKEAMGLPVLDPPREAAVVRRAASLAREKGVDEELLRDVIWRIMASARADQKGAGPRGPAPDGEDAG